MLIYNIFFGIICFLIYREETNQSKNLLQIQIDYDKTYNYIINNEWDIKQYNIIDRFIIATVKLQNDHTSPHIQFSTVISVPKKKLQNKENIYLSFVFFQITHLYNSFMLLTSIMHITYPISDLKRDFKKHITSLTKKKMLFRVKPYKQHAFSYFIDYDNEFINDAIKNSQILNHILKLTPDTILFYS